MPPITYDELLLQNFNVVLLLLHVKLCKCDLHLLLCLSFVVLWELSFNDDHERVVVIPRSGQVFLVVEARVQQGHVRRKALFLPFGEVVHGGAGLAG